MTVAAPRFAVRLCVFFLLIAQAGAVSAGDVVVVEAVPSGTKVTVRTLDAMSSNSARTGQHFRVTTVGDVVIDGNIVVPAGTPGSGTVIFAREVHLGSPGALDVRIDYLDLPGGHLKVKAVDAQRGLDNRVESMIARGFGVFGLLVVHGGETVMPQGTQIVAVVAAPPVVATSTSAVEQTTAAAESSAIMTASKPAVAATSADAAVASSVFTDRPASTSPEPSKMDRQ